MGKAITPHTYGLLHPHSSGLGRTTAVCSPTGVQARGPLFMCCRRCHTTQAANNSAALAHQSSEDNERHIREYVALRELYCIRRQP